MDDVRFAFFVSFFACFPDLNLTHPPPRAHLSNLISPTNASQEATLAALLNEDGGDVR